MKLSILIIGSVICWLILAETSISFHPFSIKFERPYFALLWIVLYLSVSQLMRVEYKKGYNDCIKDVKQVIEEVQNQKQDSL